MKHARLRRLACPTAIAPDRLVEEGETITLPLAPGEAFDAEATFSSGQIFRWRCQGETWFGPLGASALAVTAREGAVRVTVAGAALPAEAMWRFLGLDWPLAEVERRLARDRWLRAALAMYPGLRILRQHPWDCVAAFVCAQWSSIAKIESSLGALAERHGERVCLRVEGDAVAVRCFPAPERLAALSEGAFRECGLGYRAKYVLGSARAVASGEVELAPLRGLPYEEALAGVLRLPGVGRKVADCILLFCLDQPRACPIDVWVRRALREYYPRAVARHLPDAAARAAGELSAIERRALVRFAWERWGELAGHAQQYLFHARRHGLRAG